jgi:hypothetical protein
MSGAAAAWTSGRSASHRYARGRVLGSRLVLFANPALDGPGGEDLLPLLVVLGPADELVRGERELHLVLGVQRRVDLGREFAGFPWPKAHADPCVLRLGGIEEAE